MPFITHPLPRHYTLLTPLLPPYLSLLPSYRYPSTIPTQSEPAYAMKAVTIEEEFLKFGGISIKPSDNNNTPKVVALDDDDVEVCLHIHLCVCMYLCVYTLMHSMCIYVNIYIYIKWRKNLKLLMRRMSKLVLDLLTVSD
jgi:hypothetical protein